MMFCLIRFECVQWSTVKIYNDPIDPKIHVLIYFNGHPESRHDLFYSAGPG